MLPKYRILTKNDKEEFYFTLQYCTDNALKAFWLYLYYKFVQRYEVVEIKK